jgi:hypothetical protein
VGSNPATPTIRRHLSRRHFFVDVFLGTCCGFRIPASFRLCSAERLAQKVRALCLKPMLYLLEYSELADAIESGRKRDARAARNLHFQENLYFQEPCISKNPAFRAGVRKGPGHMLFRKITCFGMHPRGTSCDI